MHSVTVFIQLALVMQSLTQTTDRMHNQTWPVTGHAQGSMDSIFDMVLKVSQVNHTDLKPTTLLMGLPQKTQPWRFPKYISRRAEQSLESFHGQGNMLHILRRRLEIFQAQEGFRLLNGFVDLCNIGNSIGSFQAQERSRLQVEAQAVRSFQDQERKRLQMDVQALQTFWNQERLRLQCILESLAKVQQGLESFQDHERLRFQTEFQALQSFQRHEKLRLEAQFEALLTFQELERLRLQSLIRVVQPVDAAATVEEVGERAPAESTVTQRKPSASTSEKENSELLEDLMAQIRIRRFPPGQNSELLDQTSHDMSSISVVVLIIFSMGGGVAFAMLCLCRASLITSNEPLLFAYQ